MTELELIREYQVVDRQGRVSPFSGPFYGLEYALNRLDYVQNNWIARLKVDSEKEEEEEIAAGHMTTNWCRMAYKEALEKLPFHIVTRFVTPWKDVE